MNTRKKLIEKRLKTLNLNLKHVCEATGITQNKLNIWMCENYEFTYQQVWNIADFLSLHPEDLYRKYTNKQKKIRYGIF